MLISGKRKHLQDDNNYINRCGFITHICPNCGNVVTNQINLNVNCAIFNECDCEINSFKIETPSIDKVCTSCKSMCIQIDNAMGDIVKILIDKKYIVENCCEGHAFIKNCTTTFDLPFIVITSNIKALIPSAYYNKFEFNTSFAKTEITCKPIDMDNCPCVSLEEFNEYKTEMLELLFNLAKSLPDNPYSSNQNTATDVCGCSCDKCKKE